MSSTLSYLLKGSLSMWCEVVCMYVVPMCVLYVCDTTKKVHIQVTSSGLVESGKMTHSCVVCGIIDELEQQDTIYRVRRFIPCIPVSRITLLNVQHLTLKHSFAACAQLINHPLAQTVQV